MRVLITGGSGLLGRALMSAFSEFHPIGTAYSRLGENMVLLDILDSKQIEAVIDRYQPDVVIHAAAERRPDASERDPMRTFHMNRDATRHLADQVKKHHGWMLYISTDYVFDGENPPYAACDRPNPRNTYGQSKLEGEQAMKESGVRGGILRIPVLYGDVETLKESAVTVIIEQVLDDQPKRIDDVSIRYPTHVNEVARICRALSLKRDNQENTLETWHFSGFESFTKFGMAVEIGNILGHSVEHLHPDHTPVDVSPRPKNCQLDCAALTAMNLIHEISFRQGLLSVIEHCRRVNNAQSSQRQIFR